jgi:peptide/nickel transport system substrate-binding protein
MKQTREKMKKGAAVGIITVMLSAMLLLASVPSVMGAQFFGDANEDGTIDIKDVTYIKLIIFGKKPTTELADANQDGRINVGDVIQIKLIILRKVPFGRVVIPRDKVIAGANIIAFGGWYGLWGPLDAVYEPLVQYNPRTEEFEPWLADSWEVSSDAKEYTFHLKENAKWHDGVPVTSEDVKFTIDFLHEHRPSWRTKGVDYVECPDEHTAVIYLKTKNPRFLTPGPNPWGAGKIIPKHIWENVDDPDTFKDAEFIGSGPFKFKKRIPGEFFVVEANKDYHGKMPRVKEIVFKVMPSKDVQILAVQKGEIDVVEDISPAIANMLKGREGMKTYSIPEVSFVNFGFNCKMYPTNMTEFRRAMVYAVNKEKIINYVFGGHATLLYTPLIPSIAHDMVNYDVQKHEYDLSEAARQLKSAGFEDIDDDGVLEGPNGEDLTIIMPRNDIPQPKSPSGVTQILKEDWEELGIIVEMKDVSMWEAQDVCNLHASGCPAYGRFDPGELVWWRTYGHFDKPNWMRWSNVEYDALADEIEDTVDRETRKEIGYQMQEILADEVPVVPVCAPDKFVAYRSDNFIGWDTDVYFGPVTRTISAQW